MIKKPYVRLGVNIDHVATVRNARGGEHPDTTRAALQAQEAGADSITVHLREDRRHIRDADVFALKKAITIPINFEMAATAEMQAIALRLKPHACCLVPEKREERTTEGGLDAVGQEKQLTGFIAPLREAGIRVSLFIAPDEKQIEAAARIGAPVIEIHTGHYAQTSGAERSKEWHRISAAAAFAAERGLEVHAGHGLDYENVQAIAAIPGIRELNIGHFLVGEALFIGFGPAIERMRALMSAAEEKRA